MRCWEVRESGVAIVESMELGGANVGAFGMLVTFDC
jgi:hypothetical protein